MLRGVARLRLGQRLGETKHRPARPLNSRRRKGCCCSADWVKAGVTHSIAQHMMVRNLAERDGAARFVLAEQGRAVLSALLSR